MRPRTAAGTRGVAAALLGGMLVLGIGYLLFDARAPGADLQGSVIGAGGTGTVASRDRWTFQAEGVEASASLRREGGGLRLELKLSTAMACEVVARFDPATTTLIGRPADAALTAVSGQVIIQSETGTQAYVLDYSRAAPIELQLRSAGRLLGKGKISTDVP